MSKTSNGGPAFPSHAGDPEMTDPRNRISCGGMSLRDWFAGQALAGMCAFHGTYGEGNGPGNNAARAYEQADAMLAARGGSNA